MPLPNEKNAYVWIEEDRDSPLARRPGDGLRAGIFLLSGRYYVAAHTSPLEERLRREGALHVANLVTDPGPAERAALSGGSRAEAPPPPALRAVERRRAGEVFRGDPHRN